MVETFNNLISSEQLAWFREDFDRLINVDPVDRPYDSTEAKARYGIENCTMIDRRHILTNQDPSHQLMQEIIAPVIPKGTYFYMAYQRQFLPHQLHVDGVYPETDLNYAKSAIVPLYDDPDDIFRTIIWDKVFLTNENLQQFFKEYIADSSKFPKVSDTSNTQDVDHCWGTPSIVDVMPLDGVYKYQLGSIGMFDRTHVHCSSNWRKYETTDHKDIILLHIG